MSQKLVYDNLQSCLKWYWYSLKEKQDSRKYIVQNYRYMNKQTIKNNYPLPLISDIIENTSTKKVSTKLDLQQDYNNIGIKKEDKQKIVFMTLEKSFKSTVMFFGLTDFPAIFQTIMNKILQNLINTKKVASFIDNVIMEIEEEVYDKIIEKVKRLVENNLYIKLEKYK